MNKKSKLVKTKVVIGYVLLFLIGAISITFLYNEIIKANNPKTQISSQNQQLINLSDALTTLYKAESSGNNFNFTTSERGFSGYNNMIDSVITRMQQIKTDDNSNHNNKLDSITILLTKKKQSAAQIRILNHQYNNEISFALAKQKVLDARDSLRSSKKINFTKSVRSREFEEIFSEIFTQEQIENFNNLPVSDADLLSHYDRILTEMISREDKLKNELREKEKALLVENQALSGKVQILVSSIEKEIRDNSISEITRAQKDLERTTLILLWVGILGVILLLLFGWIILKDLTKQQKYRNKLEELNQENSTLLRSKTMLLATVTHDLQTPLGSILGFSDLLKKTNLNSTQNQYVSNISSSSDYILNLVNDLVDFSKLENNKVKINKVAFNPKQLIETTFNTLKQNAVDKEISLLYDVDSNLDENYISDPYRVKQILTNLVTNAIKFTQKGHVKITGKIHDNSIIFEVQDTGIGITSEEQKFIFEEFTQAHPDIEKQFGGTGLGLTISKRMINLLGGSIWVESIFGEGSAFSFSIPFIKDENEVNSEVNTNSNVEFLRNKKILIIDDDKMQLSLMKALFESYPIELRLMNDATKVIPFLEENDFDLVFTDIQMPKKSGFVLVQKIRNHQNSKINQIPVIALSGKRDLSLEDFTEKGFTYFIGKPIKMNEALQIMKAIFNGKKIDLKPETENLKNPVKLYDLNPLKQFISDDSEALTNIINIFLDSTKSSIEELKTYKNDLDKLAQTAHRMIPMLKQIESFELVSLLEKLENKEIPLDKTESHILNIIEKLNILTSKLKKEIT